MILLTLYNVKIYEDYQLSPYIICHHFDWKANLLAA